MKTRRCAIYTRKSSEEGLEQEFNSLHAQREACEAFIKSQKHEGWQIIKTAYDDGGISGGTMERPALRRLLDDIHNHKIDTVVVYKVDRLTRSLADFAKIIEIFDKHQVAFVSVTQQFNTTSSMGRLTLNVLLSFAQFEREVTGERIRDKIAASKKKGMWMGGHTPLGYEVKDRKLLVNEMEAKKVRLVFHRYLELGNVRLLAEELKQQEVRSKGGGNFSRGALYKILSNPLYIGQIRHKSVNHPGQHEPLIEQSLWDKVQQQLQNNGTNKRPGKTESSILIGKLFDEMGERLTPSHAIKKGRRYRYYVSRRLLTGTVAQVDHGWRLPAHEIEAVVAQSVRQALTDQAMITEALREAGIDVRHIPTITQAAKNVGTTEDSVSTIATFLGRADLRQNGLKIGVFLAPLIRQSIPGSTSDPKIIYDVPMQMKRRGVEMRLVIDKSPVPRIDMTLIKAIARAHAWADELISGKASITIIAERSGVSHRYIAQHLPLAFLAPDIIEAIIGGQQPADLTADSLLKRIEVPMEWDEQGAITIY